MPRLSLSKIGFCVTFSLLACQEKESAVSQGLVQSGAAWPGGSVATCFLNGSEREKEVIKDAVNKNFVKSVVGIEFTGWQDCRAGDGAQARVYVSPKQFDHFAYSMKFGKDDSGEVHRIREAESLGATLVTSSAGCADAYREVCLSNVTIHEFGHFAGLHHEQRRLENLSPEKQRLLAAKLERGEALLSNENNFGELCSIDGGLVFASEEFNQKLFPRQKSRPVGSFDRLSIMNYCVEGYFSKYLSLSQGDINALRDLYKVTNNSAAKSSTCNKLLVKVPLIDDDTRRAADSPVDVQFFENSRGYAVVRLSSSESMQYKIAELDPDTVVSRLQTKPWYTRVGTGESYITVIQVLVETGPHKGKQGWMYSNVTVASNFDAQDCNRFDPNSKPKKVPFGAKQ